MEKSKKDKIISTLQWMLIILLMIVLVVVLCRSCSYQRDTEMLIDDYKQENNYLKVYSSQRISALTKENKSLYDKIVKLSEVESAVEVKYVYIVNLDTVYIDVSDTTSIIDDIYHFEGDDDTVAYNLDIKADKVLWYKLDFSVKDKLTLINQEDGGLNKLTVMPTSSHMDVEDVTAWHRPDTKNKWYKKFTVGPQVGFGYGIANKKPDVFVGFSVGYDLLKR